MKTINGSDATEHTASMAAKELDEAIDRAMRQMTHVEPPLGLDRRVLARLNQPTRKSILTVPRLAAAGMAAAALVAVAISTSRAPVRPMPTVTVTRPPIVSPPPTDGHAAVVVPRATAPRHQVASAAQKRQLNVVHAATLAETDTTVTVPPLEAIVPIEVSPVEPESIEMTQIAIEPIQVTPLRVEPLAPMPR